MNSMSCVCATSIIRDVIERRCIGIVMIKGKYTLYHDRIFSFFLFFFGTVNAFFLLVDNLCLWNGNINADDGLTIYLCFCFVCLFVCLFLLCCVCLLVLAQFMWFVSLLFLLMEWTYYSWRWSHHRRDRYCFIGIVHVFVIVYNCID